MIVCLCEGVSEREVRSHCERGATDLDSIQRACGAGGDCGSCKKQIRQIIRDTRREAANPSHLFRSSLPVLVLGG